MSTLAPLRLDDLTFRDLRDATVERIPSESAGRWTLHAPVDPGITLLELLAYLLDQRIYWLDQVPAATSRAILRLLGEEVRGSRAAATVMRLTDESAPGSVQVPSGVELSLAGSDPEIVFTTDDDVLLLPVVELGVEVDGVDRSQDLTGGRGVELLPCDGGHGVARIALHLSAAPSPAADAAPASLLLRLATRTLGPAWLPRPDDDETEETEPVAPPAELNWAYRRAGSSELVPFAAGDLADGTGGLRRPGVLRFRVPSDWEPDDPDPDGRRPYSLWVRTERGTFTAPPRLLEVVPNVVVAHHAVPMQMGAADLEQQVARWLPLPGRVLDCGVPGRLVEHPGSLRVRLRERDGGWRDWEATEDLAFHGPADPVFTVDRSAGTLRFGDGLTGRLPVLFASAPRAQVSFVAGSGPAGNVGPRQLWEASAGGLSARNAVEASGGREPEAVDEARDRAASALTRRTRAITAPDHETIAESTPGVEIARAHAAVGFHPAHPCVTVPGAVTVFIVPDAPRRAEAGDTVIATPEPDPGALAAVRRRMEAARLLGSEVFVLAPRYRAVRLAVTVASPAPDEALRTALDRDLREYLDPLVGGDAREGWPFGEPLRPSALLRRAQAAAGGGTELAAVAIGMDGAAPTEDCRDVAIGPHDLVVARSVDVLGGPPAASEAGLR